MGWKSVGINIPQSDPFGAGIPFKVTGDWIPANHARRRSGLIGTQDEGALKLCVRSQVDRPRDAEPVGDDQRAVDGSSGLGQEPVAVGIDGVASELGLQGRCKP